MRIINIICHDNETGIISNESWGIHEEQLSNEVVEQAEKVFIAKVKALVPDIEDDVLEDVFQDGYFEHNGQWVSVVWSYID